MTIPAADVLIAPGEEPGPVRIAGFVLKWLHFAPGAGKHTLTRQPAGSAPDGARARCRRAPRGRRQDDPGAWHARTRQGAAAHRGRRAAGDRGRSAPARCAGVRALGTRSKTSGTSGGSCWCSGRDAASSIGAGEGRRSRRSIRCSTAAGGAAALRRTKAHPRARTAALGVHRRSGYIRAQARRQAMPAGSASGSGRSPRH